MADNPEHESNGRATVALVDAKVDGLKELIRAEFGDVQRQLESVARIEGRVRKLELAAAARKDSTDALEALDERVAKLEQGSVTSEQVKTALAFDREQRTRHTDAQFTKREKVIGLGLAGFVFTLQVAQFIHLYLS